VTVADLTKQLEAINEELEVAAKDAAESAVRIGTLERRLDKLIAALGGQMGLRLD